MCGLNKFGGFCGHFGSVLTIGEDLEGSVCAVWTSLEVFGVILGVFDEW